MKTSDQINEIAAAFAKAQGQIAAAHKDSVNPHFRSRYADLASVWDACREPLSINGLAVAQGVATEGNRVTVTTRLVHSSGQWIESSISSDARDAGPQSIGSAVTYLRRYSLSAMVGVAPDDDDGNDATIGRSTFDRQPAPPPKQSTNGNGSTNGHADKEAWDYFRQRCNDLVRERPGVFADLVSVDEACEAILSETKVDLAKYPWPDYWRTHSTDESLGKLFARLESWEWPLEPVEAEPAPPEQDIPF